MNSFGKPFDIAQQENKSCFYGYVSSNVVGKFRLVSRDYSNIYNSMRYSIKCLSTGTIHEYNKEESNTFFSHDLDFTGISYDLLREGRVYDVEYVFGDRIRNGVAWVPRKDESLGVTILTHNGGSIKLPYREVKFMQLSNL